MSLRLARVFFAIAAILALAPIADAQRGQAGQPAGPRINALVVSGGCCHDYALQGRLLMDAVSKSLPVDWTVVVQGGRGTRGSMPVYARADWSKGFDIVIHNECLADVDDPQYIRQITAAHRGGPPAVVIHCAMHSYRAATIDDWRELLGVTSRRHTRQFQIPVKVAAQDHPVMKGFKEDWVTPTDELYVIEKIWPNTTALAMAPHGDVAGSASALLGTLQFVLGAVAGSLIGAFANGTAVPMAAVVAGCGATAFLANRLVTV